MSKIEDGGPAFQDDFWSRVSKDDDLRLARQRLSMHELRKLFQHARDTLDESPKPNGETRRVFAQPIPYSSVVGGGLTLIEADGRAAFIVNFMGTTNGITKEETEAFSDQFRWFVNTFGCFVPARKGVEQ